MGVLVMVDWSLCRPKLVLMRPRVESDETGLLIGRTELTFDSEKGQLISLRIASAE